MSNPEHIASILPRVLAAVGAPHHREEVGGGMTPYTREQARENLTYWSLLHLTRGAFDSTDGSRGGCDLDPEAADAAILLAWNVIDEPLSRFRTLWAAYRQALSVPFSLDREEDARIKSEVERCFEALNRLSKEGT